MYAIALVELAQSKNALEAVHADVDALSSIFKENQGIKDFLFNPVVDEEKKKAFIKTLGKDAGLNQFTVNFLGLVMDANRIDAIEDIFTSFETEYCKLTDTQVCLV